MRRRISIRGCVRLFIHRSVTPSLRRMLGASCAVYSALFSNNYLQNISHLRDSSSCLHGSPSRSLFPCTALYSAFSFRLFAFLRTPPRSGYEIKLRELSAENLLSWAQKQVNDRANDCSGACDQAQQIIGASEWVSCGSEGTSRQAKDPDSVIFILITPQ